MIRLVPRGDSTVPLNSQAIKRMRNSNPRQCVMLMVETAKGAIRNVLGLAFIAIFESQGFHNNESIRRN
jgi:hypothetical protein